MQMPLSTLDPRRSTVAQVWRFAGDAEEYEALLRRTARAFPRATPVMLCWGVDVLTKCPWWLVPLFWGPLSLAMMATGVGDHGVSPWVVAGGVGAWPAIEYILHRFVFHHVPRSRVSRVLLYMLHGCHHAFPGDPLRLVLPLTMSVPWAFALLLCASLAMPVPCAMVLTGAIAAAYTAYDVTHYVVHHMTRVRRWRLFAYAKQRHINQHHMGDWNSSYGITSGAVDVLMKS
jgi:hypothetical protein